MTTRSTPLLVLLVLSAALAARGTPPVALPPGAWPVVEGRTLGNYELRVDFMLPPGGRGSVDLGGGAELLLSDSGGRTPDATSSGAIEGERPPVVDAAGVPGAWQVLEASYTRYPGKPAVVSAWLNGRLVQQRVRLARAPDAVAAQSAGEPWFVADAATSSALDLDQGFTAVARFAFKRGGTLFAKSPPAGRWVPGGKALFARAGRLVYAVGGVGEATSRQRFSDGRWHTVALSSDAGGRVVMAVDGEVVARETLRREDVDGHRLKVGQAASDFSGRFGGEIDFVRVYRGAADALALSRGVGAAPGEPAWSWQSRQTGEPLFPLADGVARESVLFSGEGVRFANAWARPLASVDHVAMIESLDELALRRGERLYQSLCVDCHGADGREPTLSVARAFGSGPFLFGSDPVSLFDTLTEGRGSMGPQTWMTEQERYDVIHYIRETYVKPMYPGYQAADAAYLAALPRPVAEQPVAANEAAKSRDFGLALGSQLEDRAVSALTVALGGGATIGYDLHTMDQVGVWSGGFLDLRATQHHRLRGEGQPRPAGKLLAGLDGWRWGHAGKLDYAADRKPARGPLPADMLEYRGYHLHGDRLVLEYRIDGRRILERPEKQQGLDAIVHTLRIGPGPALVLAVARPEVPGPIAGVVPLGQSKTVAPSGQVAGVFAISGSADGDTIGQFSAAAVLGDVSGLTWSVDPDHGLVLHIPATRDARVVQVLRYGGQGPRALQSFDGLVRHTIARGAPEDPEALLSGGPARWAQRLETEGMLGPDDGPYTLDTLVLPESNPWGAWLRTSALDFFADGRLVVTTYGGDVWLVSGVDDELESLRWKRFAAGLYEPMGVKVIDNQVYVTCKDRIVRLHDRNGDDEADFYESFSADTDVSSFFHAYNFDLQADTAGNLYYAKAGELTDYALPGAVIKLTPDGKQRAVYCTGFRMPNGLGMLPGDRLTVSDNQGHWIPASKVSLCTAGGFYGYVQTLMSRGHWAPDGGRIDPKKIALPDSFDPPIIWMPLEFDNSSGGQLYVDDERWGPLSGRLLHTSFGQGRLYYLMIQEVGDVAQAAIVQLALDFDSGIHRARVNPADGQVYATGLSGWNATGRKGLAEGGIQRVRYTGKPGRFLTDFAVRPGGIALRFDFELDETAAADSGRYDLQQWNYRWTAGYGSAQWSVMDPTREGSDPVVIDSVQVSPDGRGVFLSIPGLGPVHQIRMKLDLESAAGEAFTEQAYLTINRVPDR